MPSVILIHPTVWPQYIYVMDRQDKTDYGPIAQGEPFLGDRLYNSSAVAEMGHCGHNRHGPKKGTAVRCPFREELGPRQCNVAAACSAEVYTSVPSGVFIHPAVWPCQHEPKTGGCALLGGAATPSNTTSPWPRFKSYLSTK